MSTYEAGSIFWHEYLAADVPAAIAFYSEVVGWKTEPYGPMAGYTMWLGSAGPLGGVTALGPRSGSPGTGAHWTSNVQVDDVDATVRRAVERGGRIHSAPEDVPDIGRVASIVDPFGASIAVFRPVQPMEAHDPSRHGEFCWAEIQAPDGAAAAGFYGALFGWSVLDQMDMGPAGTYRIFGLGDRRLGGIFAPAPGVAAPAAWLFYVSTDDLDAALARAARAGGAVLLRPTDVPGGRMAQLRDPQGAAFGLHEAFSSAPRPR